MGSVNSTAAPIAPSAAPKASDGAGWDFFDGVDAMGRSLGSTSKDIATLVGVKSEDGELRAAVDPLAMGGFAAASVGGTAVMALRNRVDPLTGASTGYLDRLGTQATLNGIRITPTLVSALVGPAVADGVTMLAPNLVKKHKATTGLNAEQKKQVDKDNQQAKISRAIVGGAAVGLVAGAVFLLKPDVFKRFQSEGGRGLVDRAIKGSTHFTVNGQSHKLAGVLDLEQITRSMAAAGKPIHADDTVGIVKTVQAMRRDAAFTNRTGVMAAGSLGTVLLANHAAGEQDPERQRLLWGLTAAAGALTVGGAAGIGKLTERSVRANGGAGGLLAKNDLLMKPNIEWVKKYATTIAPITAVPAGTAASQYFNVVDDFDDITSTRSPFRK